MKKVFSDSALNIDKISVAQQTQAWYIFIQTLYILLLRPAQTLLNRDFEWNTIYNGCFLVNCPYYPLAFW